MLRVGFTEADVFAAASMAQDLGVLPGSMLRGGGSAAGYLAEIAIARHLGAKLVSCDPGAGKFNHDMVLPDGPSVELKTKRRTVRPRPNFAGTVARTSLHQTPDLLMFASVTFASRTREKPWVYRNPTEIWLCGFITPAEFKKEAYPIERGKPDGGGNGFTATADALSINYSSLSVCGSVPLSSASSSSSALTVASSFASSSTSRLPISAT